MVWTDIVLEGFCVAKDKKVCRKRKSTEEEKADGIENPVAKKLVPEFWCFNTDCPYFTCCNGTEDLYLWLNKYYKKNPDNI